jgi:hypothetical protein
MVLFSTAMAMVGVGLGAFFVIFARFSAGNRRGNRRSDLLHWRGRDSS